MTHTEFVIEEEAANTSDTHMHSLNSRIDGIPQIDLMGNFCDALKLLVSNSGLLRRLLA